MKEEHCWGRKEEKSGYSSTGLRGYKEGWRLKKIEDV
jgi:hypothetical protein